MIRARASTKKRKRFARLFTPVVPPQNLPVIQSADGKFRMPGEAVNNCACGEPWVVAFPGQIAFPATTVNHMGMTCALEPAIAARDSLYLCMACAVQRGWLESLERNRREREKGDEPAVELHSATNTAAGSDGEAGDQEGTKG